MKKLTRPPMTEELLNHRALLQHPEWRLYTEPLAEGVELDINMHNLREKESNREWCRRQSKRETP